MARFGWSMIREPPFGFLWNDVADAHKIADRLQTLFGEHADALGAIRFWIAEAWLSRQDFHDESRIGSPLLDDLGVKILAIETNLLSNQLVQ
jgi:hypothetical protein